MLRLHPATPGTGARCGCVCFGSGLGCTPPLLAWVFGCVCARVRAPLAPCHSWLGCAVWVCVFWLGFQLRPATPGWGVGLCVCSCARSACTQPLLARVRGVGVCVWAWVSAAPRHSWLGCAVWVCMFGVGFRLRPATPGWAVGLCVCSCARPACTQPLLARSRGVGVCVWARVSAAPRHSWQGCWAVCVLVCAPCLHPATPGSGARCGCVCLGSGFSCTPPLLAGVLGCVCARVRAPLAPRHSWLGCAVWVCVFGLGFRLRPATPGWDVGLCVCSCARSACTQPFLARVRGVGVCVWAWVSAAPRHSWLGCAVWVCMFGVGFWLRPATPGWGVGLCVCLCARPACTPPLLAGVRGVGVCVWAGVSAASRHSWLGCWAVCVLVCALRLHPATPGAGARSGCVCLGSGLAAPRHSWLGFVLFWLAVAWHLFLWRGSLHVVRALRVCGTRRPSLLGTCPCALVVVGGVPLWRASWPRVVHRASSGQVALGAPVGFLVAVVPFPIPRACAPGFTGRVRGARGGRPRTGLFVPAAGPRRGGGAGLAPRCTRSGPRDGVVPGGSLRRWSRAACAAVVGVCGPGH